MKGRIVAICTSADKGEAKAAVTSAEAVVDHGLSGDAHAGNWHRQVSLLAQERVDELRAKGLQLEAGAFGENLLTQGLDLAALAVGDRLRIGDSIELEVTQLGKECHQPCQIFYQVGMCIMPTTGVFCRVLSGGSLQVGDPIGPAA